MSTSQRVVRSEVGTDLGKRMYCALALDRREDFCVRCEVTQKWCKVRNFRPCTIRVEFFRRQGKNVFEVLLPEKYQKKLKQKKLVLKTRRGRG